MADEVSEIVMADKANVIDVIVAANEADLMLLDNGIAYSLTKYCAIFAKMKEYFGMMISSNQHGRWNLCSLRSQNGTCRIKNVFLSLHSLRICVWS